MRAGCGCDDQSTGPLGRMLPQPHRMSNAVASTDKPALALTIPHYARTRRSLVGASPVFAGANFGVQGVVRLNRSLQLSYDTKRYC